MRLARRDTRAWALYEPAEKNGTLWYEAVTRPGADDEPFYPPVQLADAPAPTAAETARKQRDLFKATFGPMFAKKDDAAT